MKIQAFVKTIEGRAAHTRRNYEQTLWQLNHVIKGSEPTDDEVYRFLRKYSTSSLNRHQAAIKAYFFFRKRMWPFQPSQFPRTRKKLPRYKDVSVIEEMRDAADNEDDRMFVWTLFTLGCRIHELMLIEEENITPVGVLVATKGGETHLKNTTAAFSKELGAYAQGKKGKIFPMTYTYYYQKIRDLGAEVGHPEIRPHWLRHSRAIDLLNKGMKPVHLQQFMDHQSFSTTAVYLEITGGELTGELEKVEAAGSTGA